MKSLPVLVFYLCVFCVSGNAKISWELKKDSDEIKVYVANVPGQSLKLVKVECDIDASLSQLVALLLDAKAHKDWVYSTESSYEVKKISANHQIYYSELGMPWPIENRDVVIELKIVQDSSTKYLHISSHAVDGYVPPTADKVRISMSRVNWIVMPVSTHKIKIQYIAQIDPGGSLPTWVANTFSTKGPFETFKQLRKTINKPAYKKAAFDFIRE